MKPFEAYQNLRESMKTLIVKMGALKNETAIMALLEAYISDCQTNSHYDQVANVNNLIAMANRGDIRDFLGAIQARDTLTHINHI